MRAVVIREFGPVENLSMGDLPDPSPGPDEVLVEIRATAANFVDLLVVTGRYQFLPPRPFAPGKLPVGVVCERGADVTSIAVGDRVLTLAEHGGYAEKICVPAADCFRLPPSLSFVEAAAMSLAYDTAWFALRERARCRPGESVLVLGASGGVGFASVQLAKAMGLRVLGGVSSAAKGPALREAGCDAIVDLGAADLHDNLREQVRAITGGGVDIVLDMVGGDVFDAALRAVAWRGRVVVIGFASGRIPTIKANYLLVKNIEVSGLQISDYRKRTPALMAECIAQLFQMHEAGTLRPASIVTYPLERFADALAALQDRRGAGRIVLTQGPQDQAASSSLT
jgi:NADPH2:quinone reductase